MNGNRENTDAENARLVAEMQAMLAMPTENLTLLAPLAFQICAMALGLAETGTTAADIRKMDKTQWMLMAKHIQDFMRSKGVGLVKLQ